eukprot:TRINITY_DN3926_c0_g1_i1.p1 TRINITY_DN3926_c0_g1~~TRINITY_DN3926_c0_g1_i1.p1  ORF type:complete len:412 (+),score=81.45 TRINITY_DN3926_c0_g1_i1:159-1394(+)
MARSRLYNEIQQLFNPKQTVTSKDGAQKPNNLTVDLFELGDRFLESLRPKSDPFLELYGSPLKEGKVDEVSDGLRDSSDLILGNDNESDHRTKFGTRGAELPKIWSRSSQKEKLTPRLVQSRDARLEGIRRTQENGLRISPPTRGVNVHSSLAAKKSNAAEVSPYDPVFSAQMLKQHFNVELQMSGNEFKKGHLRRLKANGLKKPPSPERLKAEDFHELKPVRTHTNGFRIKNNPLVNSVPSNKYDYDAGPGTQHRDNFMLNEISDDENKVQKAGNDRYYRQNGKRNGKLTSKQKEGQQTKVQVLRTGLGPINLKQHRPPSENKQLIEQSLMRRSEFLTGLPFDAVQRMLSDHFPLNPLQTSLSPAEIETLQRPILDADLDVIYRSFLREDGHSPIVLSGPQSHADIGEEV